MDHLNGANLHHLDRHVPGARVLKLKHARGTRIVAVAGDIWITEDGRHDDVVLAAGESAALERDGMAMITTFDSADVEVVPPAGAATAMGETRPIDGELIDRQIRAAHRLRAQAMAAAFADGVEWLRAKLRPAPQRECCA